MTDLSFEGVKAVLFDFEGTLVDHQWNRQGAVQETLKRLQAIGLPITQLHGKKYSLLKNEAVAVALKAGHPPEEVVREIDNIYDRFDEDALRRWTLRPQVKDFLSLLKSFGIQTGLVTNLGRRILVEGLTQWDLLSLFEILVSRNDVQQPKPNGEGIRLALDRLGVPGGLARFIGDSLDDIRAAKEAGVSVIIIQGGENTNEDLLAEGPDALIQSYGELIALLKEGRR